MNKKWIYITVIAVVVIAIATVGTIYGINYFSPKSYVATVAGEKISKGEYTYFLSYFKNQMEQTANLADEKAITEFWTKTKIGGEDAIDALKTKALEEAKSLKVQVIKAKESKVSLEKEDIDSINDYFKQIVDSSGGEAEAEKKVQEIFNISFQQYKQIFKEFKLVEKFMSESENKMEITDDEITKYTNENEKKVEFATVRHILFSTTDLNTQEELPKAEQDKAKKKAEEILAKVRSGEDMVTLAQENSEDPSVSQNGGEFTFDGNGKLIDSSNGLVDEFPQWAFSDKVAAGDSDIVKTKFGYHILKLEKRSTPEEEKENAKTAIKEKRYMDQLDAWKKDQKFNIIKNEEVFNSIKVI